MNCPDCNVALDERKYRSLEVDHCPQCRGLWLDFDELDLLEDTANRDEILKGQREYARRSGERPCPHCGAAMDIFNYRAHNLPIDHCPNNHGYWLDKGEEDRVLDLMKQRVQRPAPLRVSRAAVGKVHGTRRQPRRLPGSYQGLVSMTAKIVSSHGDELSSLEEWAKLHKEVHWKKGRSAYTLADFVLNGEGASHLESRLSEVLERKTYICRITPEKEVRFDRYGRGRFHDLAIEGVVGSDMTLFVGVEAKVDESLGPTVQERYEGAEKELLKNSRSKATERIRNLPELVRPGLELRFDTRYSLSAYSRDLGHDFRAADKWTTLRLLCVLRARVQDVSL